MVTLRFTTLRIGVITVSADDPRLEIEVRVVRASDGSHRLFCGGLSEPLPSLEAAVAEGERAATDAEAETVRWRDDGAAFGPGEGPCPVCGALATASSRYPRCVCPVCKLEATDAHGRPLRFSNVGLSGGFEARYADDGARYDSHECFVRGVRCRADQARFGGIVVQPV